MFPSQDATVFHALTRVYSGTLYAGMYSVYWLLCTIYCVICIVYCVHYALCMLCRLSTSRSVGFVNCEMCPVKYVVYTVWFVLWIVYHSVSEANLLLLNFLTYPSKRSPPEFLKLRRPPLIKLTSLNFWKSYFPHRKQKINTILCDNAVSIHVLINKY